MMKRFDIMVCKQLDVSREYAKEIILAGKCSVDGEIITKPGAKIAETSKIASEVGKLPFVSRGGLKLAHALEKFHINLQGLRCLDIGASTGGFTDCMLQRGAKCVIALDNGHGQLAQTLHHDPRVIPIEGRDIRGIILDDLPYQPDFIATDLSFISLTLVIPKVSELLEAGGKAVFLVKPQFECGRTKLDKKGVVRSQAARDKAVKRIRDALADNGFAATNIDQSPITGQNGNVEYLILAEKRDA